MLIDYATPGVDSSSICRRILTRHPDGKIIVLSDSIDVHGLIRTLADGASGHLPLQPTLVQLQDCIQTVLNGRIYLGARRSRSGSRKAMNRPADDDRVSPSDFTPRELDVLALLADGATTRRMAAALCISEKPAETHRSHIMQKLGIHSIAGLTKFAVKTVSSDWTPIDGPDTNRHGPITLGTLPVTHLALHAKRRVLSSVNHDSHIHIPCYTTTITGQSPARTPCHELCV